MAVLFGQGADAAAREQQHDGVDGEGQVDGADDGHAAVHEARQPAVDGEDAQVEGEDGDLDDADGEEVHEGLGADEAHVRLGHLDRAQVPQVPAVAHGDAEVRHDRVGDGEQEGGEAEHVVGAEGARDARLGPQPDADAQHGQAEHDAVGGHDGRRLALRVVEVGRDARRGRHDGPVVVVDGSHAGDAEGRGVLRRRYRAGKDIKEKRRTESKGSS